MAYTAPMVFVALSVLTASQMNTLQDNIRATAVGIASAAGQVPYATGPNALAMLSAVAGRMPRFNAAANALETAAGVNLAQAPIFNGSFPSTNLTASQQCALGTGTAITTTGGAVLVIAGAVVAEIKSGASVLDHFMGIARKTSAYSDGSNVSGTTLSNELAYALAPGAGGYNSSFTNVFMDTPAAGTYYYVPYITYVNNATTGTPTAVGRFVLLAEFAA